MYAPYDQGQATRSPGAHRNPSQSATLHRMPSRQFDAYQQFNQPNLYPQDDQARGYEQPQPRSHDRLHQTVGYGYDMGTPAAWNTNAFSQNGLGSLGGTAGARMRTQQQQRGRGAIPSAWMNQPGQSAGPPGHTLPGLGNGNPNLIFASGFGQEDEDDSEKLIPTAMVIKNIPFAVRKEQLVQLMTDLRLPLPYAFNYHFDNGVFRGLAFCNYTTHEETATSIDALNHFELNGRKLRVEYKKLLPVEERERIEREKRERRGQLEEQHRPSGGQLHSQASYGSLASHIPATSPSPVSGTRSQPRTDVDMNDPQVLQFYSQMLLFKQAEERDSMVFPSTLTPTQRRIVHTLAHQLGLMHVSRGTGEQRQVHVLKVQDASGLSPPLSSMPTSHPSDQPRRTLNRAATTDFSDVRDGFYNNAFGSRQASGLLGFPDSPGGLNAVPNLRGARSYADLRSYTPSPAPSTASHPAGRPNGISLEGLGFNGSLTNPNGTPTTSSMSQRDEGLLETAMGRMQLGGGFGQSSSPRSLRQMTSWDAPGPIGGHRTFGNGYEDRPSRQPRGPLPERGNGFGRPRQNGHQNRGSDELSSQSNVELIAGQ